jgi:hypothetical protein
MIAWSTLVTFLVRISAAAIFRRLVRAERVYIAAHLTIPALFLLGLLVVGISGMPMYGFDAANWLRWLGYVTFVFSPFGLPLLFGTPVVVVADLLRRPWRTSRT